MNIQSHAAIRAIVLALNVASTLLAQTRVDAHASSSVQPATDQGLIGHWTLRGDCQDHSACGNHGVNHGVDLGEGQFDGRGSYISVANSDSLKLGTGDFSICVNVWTPDKLDDIIGDVICMYDSVSRTGFNLSINSTAGGYQGPGDDRHVYFGIDQGRLSEWQDCGRPNRTSNYVSNSLTAFRGALYAATTDAATRDDWCRVYRYDGQQRWIDCGRVGDRQTTGVGPLIVHGGSLYAVTSTIDWTRVHTGDYDAGRVYRYEGGTTWTDCGQPSENRTVNCAGSFRDKLYVGGGPTAYGVYTQDADGSWRPSQLFAMTGSRRCFPHAMCRFNGKLYTGYPSVYAFDGVEWTYAGVPVEPVEDLQTHALTVHRGQLCAGTWPRAIVSRYVGGETWQPMGRVGQDGTEVNSLVVYNGKLYGGSIPRAEVCRFDDAEGWTSLHRFYSPPGWTPVPPAPIGGNPSREDVNEWTRVTSLTVCQGRLFAGIGSCTSSVADAPADVRGRVFSIEAGKCISYDDDLGPGWHHLVAMREHDRLKLYVDGKLVVESAPFDPKAFDLSADQPLRIGFGESDYFLGKLRDVRVYSRALSQPEISLLAADRPD